MRNRGIGRARMFMGSLLLFAAVVAWATTLMMSPHGQAVADGTEHVRTVVAIVGVLSLLAATSIYQLIWVGSLLS